MQTATGIAVLVMAYGLASGQSVDPAATFEVASIKPSPPPDGRPRAVRATGVPGSPYGKDPGRFTTENYSLPSLIMMAYDIPYYRLSAPDLPFNVSFNIEARMPIDTTKEQFQVMLRNLLAERFGLKVHWVSRQLAMYDLVVGKGGSKLKPATPDPPPETADSDSRRTAFPEIQRGPDGFPVPPPGNQRWMAMTGDKAAMRGHNQTAAEIASEFSAQVNGPINDKTGLAGKYDYTIFWSTANLAPAGPDAAAPADAGPTLFDALQQQLGLKLESRKGPVEVLVVDHVQMKPTDN